jgi:hypothetical protein
MATPQLASLLQRLVLALLTLAVVTSTGCYTAQDIERLRAQQASAPDPRHEQVERLWEAMGAVVQEEAWPVALERRQDLIIVTQWMQVDPSLRRKVRLLALVAPNGVAINVSVDHQRRDERLGPTPEEQWGPVDDPALAVQARRLEQALARRVQEKWAQGS